MHTGDNMLAIYASEKALRLAERLGEARGRQPRPRHLRPRLRPHRRLEKARENLERSVELARDSDRAEAVRALLTLGYHLEVSEADYDGAGGAYREALDLAGRSATSPPRSSSTPRSAQLAVYAADWEAVERGREASASLAEREGLTGKLCFPYVMRGVLRWREGDWDEAAKSCRRAHELGEQVGRSEVAFSALLWLAATLRDRGDHIDRRDRADPRRSTSASAPGSSPSRSRRSRRAPSCLALAGRTEQAPGRGRGGRPAGRAAALPGRRSRHR